MSKLDLLKPKVKALAEKLVSDCELAGCPIIVTQTLRTIAEQDALYAQGRTKPGNIVTKARGGYSLHNYGVAFDICPLLNGQFAWNNTDLFKKVGAMGMKLGLEWGGTWTSFVDLPHFQYLAGYTLDDFRNNRVDWTKFEVDKLDTYLETVVKPPTPEEKIEVAKLMTIVERLKALVLKLLKVG